MADMSDKCDANVGRSLTITRSSKGKASDSLHDILGCTDTHTATP